MKNREVAALTEKYVAKTYARAPIALVKGRGAKVWDADGKEYLDFLAGIAVNSLGHCNPAIVKAIKQQAQQLLHVSNLYHIQPQAELARELCRHSFADRAFFCNSGAEANEAAIKLARRYGLEKRAGKFEILSTHNSFHGRTLATLTATGQEKIRAGYDPLPVGFRQVPYNDLNAVEAAIDGQKTVAILVEPIQAEGGVVVANEIYMLGLREICDQRGLLLIFDEVQTGMGRTGRPLAIDHFPDAEPDLVVWGKSLGGGLPLAGVSGRAELLDAVHVGGLGGTFGGNPISCAAALASLDQLDEPGFLERAATLGEKLRARLEVIAADCRLVGDVRGLGPMLGIELVTDPASKEPASAATARVVELARERGLMLMGAGIYSNVVRVLVPLVATEEDIDTGLDVLADVLAEVAAGR
jgi:acetylornithine/N-succinyldiaminopimelate aminotransferase